MIKPHRLLRERVTDITAEAAAFLRRRKQDREPFARVYYPSGRSASYAADTDAGRTLFLAASHIIEVAGAPRTRRERARGAAAKASD